MLPPLEIFRVEKDGALIWCEAVASVEVAKTRIDELAAMTSAQYVVVSRTTGHRRVFGSPGVQGSSEGAIHQPPKGISHKPGRSDDSTVGKFNAVKSPRTSAAYANAQHLAHTPTAPYDRSGDRTRS